jgi:hypothetical protein
MFSLLIIKTELISENLLPLGIEDDELDFNKGFEYA